MKKRIAWLVVTIVIWIGLMVFYAFGAPILENPDTGVSVEDMETIETTQYTSANIWLKQTVHGTGGVKYRYVIETDCPNWDFETRYVTDKPIEWVGDTSAVEVVVQDVQIRYNGHVRASGQYYFVPLFDGVASENISLDAWKENLMKQAIDACQVNGSSRSLLMAIIGGATLAILWQITAIAEEKTNKKKDKEAGNQE